MSNYRQTKAKLASTIDNGKPKTTTLELTDKALTGLAGFKRELQDIELRIVMRTNPVPRCFDDCEIMDDRKRLMIIRSKIDMKQLMVACEFKGCASKRMMVPIYLSRCGVCSHRVKSLLDPSTTEGALRFDLLTLRNLIVRVAYLEQQLSLSLSGQTKKDEIEPIISEALTIMSL